MEISSRLDDWPPTSVVSGEGFHREAQVKTHWLACWTLKYTTSSQPLFLGSLWQESSPRNLLDCVVYSVQYVSMEFAEKEHHSNISPFDIETSWMSTSADGGRAAYIIQCFGGLDGILGNRRRHKNHAYIIL